MKRVIIFIAILFFITACKKKEKSAEFKVNDPNYDKGLAFYETNRDSAFYFFNTMARTSKDNFNVGLGYCLMAEIQFNAGDYFGSEESATESLKFLSEKRELDHSIIAADNNILGRSSQELRRFKAAIDYFNIALKFNKDPGIRLRIINNKALAYQKMGEYAKAIKLYEAIIPEYKNDSEQYVRAISNLAKTKWLENSHYKASDVFLTALHVREQKNDKWGLNASYSHLADYYAASKPDSALLYANKMYATAKDISSPDDQVEALQKLITLSPASKTKEYFERYQQLNDSLISTRNAAKNQFALVRFETEKQKADNLKLKYQLIALGIFILAGTIGAIIWYRKRKQRLQLEAQTAIRESQLRTSKKVHDVVANGLYTVMSEIENRDELDKEKILDKIEDLYEKSRDISYDRVPVATQRFHTRLQDILQCFETEKVEVVIKGNDENTWDSISDRVKSEIEHILQELMVNMDKHSQASHVEIEFNRQPNQLSICYTDNGIGMTVPPNFKNGLTNTENRIESISGSITFETNGGGLSIQIAFPVS